jgi:hypothetical protein
MSLNYTLNWLNGKFIIYISKLEKYNMPKPTELYTLNGLTVWSVVYL